MLIHGIVILLILLHMCLHFLKRKKNTTNTDGFEIYVISLEQKEHRRLKRLFPNISVNTQPGVDIRKVSTDNILKSKIIDAYTHHSILNGRTYHHDIGTHGAIGLAWANKLVFDKGDCDLFLFEEDYNIIDDSKLLEEVRLLQKNRHKFDIAVFGGIVRRKDSEGVRHVTKPVPWMPNGWVELNGGSFFLTHAVYYTSTGRKKIRDLLFKTPIDMQIDSLYGEWAAKHNIKILIQNRYKTIRQRNDGNTTIQTDHCKTCK